MTAADRIRAAELAVDHSNTGRDARVIALAILALAQAVSESTTPPALCENCRGHHEDCLCG